MNKDAQLESLQVQIKDLAAENTRLLDLLEKERSDFKKRLTSLQTEREDLVDDVDQLEYKCAQLQKECMALEEDLEMSQD